MNLNVLAAQIHRNALEHGWWPEPNLLGSTERYDAEFPGKIALVHSEVSEVLEAFRDHHEPRKVWLEKDGVVYDRTKDSPETHGFTDFERVQTGWKPEGIPVELADVLIRVLDMCAAYGINIEKAVKLKMEYNLTRPHKHGGKKL